MSVETILADRISDAIYSSTLKPDHENEFISTIAGLDYHLTVEYEEDWSEPQVLTEDEYGRKETGREFYGYCHIKVKLDDVYTDEGETIKGMTVDTRQIVKEIREYLK